MKTMLDICYAQAPHSRSYLDIYLPEDTPRGVLVYFHGGGIEAGSKSFSRVDTLTQQGIAVVCPNYRLYPNAAFPEFLEDAAEAAAWVKSHSELFSGCNNLYIGGSSAGGYISMMLYFDPRYLGKHGLSCKDFAGFVLDAGQPTTHFNVLRERGLDTRRVICDEAAPLFHVAEYDGQPKMQIFVAEHDMENRLPQTQLLLSTLRHFHYPEELVEYHYMEGYKHCGYTKTEAFANMVADFILRI